MQLLIVRIFQRAVTSSLLAPNILLFNIVTAHSNYYRFCKALYIGVLLEKINFDLLAVKFPVFYGTRSLMSCSQ
jgi:hypothetical protein